MTLISYMQGSCFSWRAFMLRRQRHVSILLRRLQVYKWRGQVKGFLYPADHYQQLVRAGEFIFDR